MDLDLVKQLEDFDDHRLVTFFHDSETDLNGFISIHRGNNDIPAFGATRIWNYRSYNEALVDSLRLSKTMSRKAALAGLKCGGAKAVIVAEGKIKNRREFLKAYSKKVNLLGGHFITGADVGISRDDVIMMRRFSRYFVGVNVDPVKYTGLGLFYSIQACLKEVYGKESLEGKSFAIQGVGKIGGELLRLIYNHSHNIYVSDVDKLTLKRIMMKYPNVKVVDSGKIFNQKVDAFCPCALSNCLNFKTIKLLNCSVIAGGANNQLESDGVADVLYKRSILYAPDYVVNSGGLISVYAEYENHGLNTQYVRKKVAGTKLMLKKNLELSRRRKLSTLAISNELAGERIMRLK